MMPHLRKMQLLKQVSLADEPPDLEGGEGVAELLFGGNSLFHGGHLVVDKFYLLENLLLQELLGGLFLYHGRLLSFQSAANLFVAGSQLLVQFLVFERHQCVAQGRQIARHVSS